MNELLSALPFTEGDTVCSLSSEVAAEHEYIGFVAGFQLGVQLMLELGKEAQISSSMAIPYSSKVCNLWYGHPFQYRLYLSW